MKEFFSSQLALFDFLGQSRQIEEPTDSLLKLQKLRSRKGWTRSGIVPFIESVDCMIGEAGLRKGERGGPGGRAGRFGSLDLFCQEAISVKQVSLVFDILMMLKSDITEALPIRKGERSKGGVWGGACYPHPWPKRMKDRF